VLRCAGTLAYVYLGSIGQAAQSGLSPIKLTLYVIGGVATLAVTKVISDIARKQLGDDGSAEESSQLRDPTDGDAER
jgi:hypothetical protein